MATTKKKTDLSAALTGLILGAVTIFLLLTSIVMITNGHYREVERSEGGSSATPSAEPATTTPAPAPH